MRDTRTERTGLLVALTLALAIGSAALLRDQVALAVPLLVFLGLLAPVVAFAICLRMHAETWGREGRYVDLWSIPHALLGVYGFLLGIDLVYVVVIAVVWEGIEVAARVGEYATNRVLDVVLAGVGWGAGYLALFLARPM